MNKPDDPQFNRAVKDLILNATRERAIAFINHENKVAHLLHHSEFDKAGAVRADMESRDVLKAVVHIAEQRLPYGGSFSVIEYLPDESYYSIALRPVWTEWKEYDPEEGR